MILEEHVRRSRLDLGVKNGKPQLLRLDGLSDFAFSFVAFVQGFKLVAETIGETGALVGAQQGPGAVVLDALHEEIRHPHGEEQIARAITFVPVVFAQIQKGKDVRVPGFQVNGDGSLAFATALVDVPRRIVKDTEHGYDAVGGAVSAANVALAGPNVMNGEANTSSILGNDGAVLERIVDAVDGVFLHCHEKAGTHLWHVGAGVEERGGGVRKVSLRQKVVGLNDPRDIVSVDTDGHTHEHKLRALGNLAIDLEQVGLFERFEPEVVVLEITRVYNGAVEFVLVLLHNLIHFFGNQRGGFTRFGVFVIVKDFDEIGETSNRHFVQVGNRNARRQDGIIGMLGSERSSGLCRESVKARNARGKNRSPVPVPTDSRVEICDTGITYSSSSEVVTPG